MHVYLPKSIPMEKTELKEMNEKPAWHWTILVVEDESMIQEFVKTVLETNWYDVITADDWKEWLDRYMENMNSIDMVILDLTMPRMSGQAVLEKMLEIKNDVKVIISSGQNNEEARWGILTKAKWFINKPYRVEALTNMVKSVLESE